MTGFQLPLQSGKWAIALCLSLGLTACVEREEILTGKRFDLREGLSVTVEDAILAETAEAEAEKQDSAIAFGADFALSLPAQQNVTNWTHKNGSISHRVTHPEMGANLSLRWTANAGPSSKIKLQITSDPVVLNDQIFVQDAASVLHAIGKNGVTNWTRDLTPEFEKSGQASGGGVSASEGAIIATTGFGEAIALDPETGTVLWRHRLNASVASAPVIVDDLVVVVSRDNIATGLDISNGRVLWVQQSTGSDPGIIGAGTPAATKRLVVLPFTNGEVIGVLTRNGQRVWSSALTGTRLGAVRSALKDISGDPVIDGRTIYAANQAGQLVSLDRRNGSRNWTVNEGSYGPVWPVAGSVFFLSDKAKIKRLDASDGSEIWSVDLPDFVKEKKRFTVYTHFGPIIAGGRLWVASSDGVLRSFDPETGAPMGEVTIPGGAAAAPAISDGVMYIVSAKGQLHAFQ
jgi:outer membrane protein assembly factor BamB